MRINKLFLLPFLALFPKLVHAHCPLCSAAVGTGAVVAKYYGVDPTVIGLFVGAFALSTGIWLANWIKKQYIPYQKSLIVLSSLLLTIIPVIPIVPDSFYFPLSIGSFTKVFWLNKILIGSLLGIIVSGISFVIHNYIKKVRGKVLFPYQGVVLPIIFLLLTFAALYFVL